MWQPYGAARRAWPRCSAMAPWWTAWSRAAMPPPGWPEGPPPSTLLLPRATLTSWSPYWQPSTTSLKVRQRPYPSELSVDAFLSLDGDVHHRRLAEWLGGPPPSTLLLPRASLMPCNPLCWQPSTTSLKVRPMAVSVTILYVAEAPQPRCIDGSVHQQTPCWQAHGPFALHTATAKGYLTSRSPFWQPSTTSLKVLSFLHALWPCCGFLLGSTAVNDKSVMITLLEACHLAPERCISCVVSTECWRQPQPHSPGSLRSFTVPSKLQQLAAEMIYSWSILLSPR